MIRSARSTMILAALLAGGLAVSGCARQISSDSYEGRAAGEVQRTYMGTIENVRVVEIQESDTLERNKTGQLLGGLAGGVAGARFGDGIGQVLASVGGAIAGAFVGSLAEQEIKRQPAYEYIIRTETGELVTIVQGTDTRLNPGQRVFVQEAARGRGRVIPAT